jgi:uncharacterized coiled-coil protein SlyX
MHQTGAYARWADEREALNRLVATGQPFTQDDMEATIVEINAERKRVHDDNRLNGLTATVEAQQLEIDRLRRQMDAFLHNAR